MTNEPELSLFDAIKEAGILYANHESDLYFPVTEQSRAILARYPLQKGNASFHLDSDDCGGYYHPIHAIGWKSAQMGQAELQGCCYATTEQVLTWFARKGAR